MRFGSYQEAKAAHARLLETLPVGEGFDYTHWGAFLRDCEIPRDEYGFFVGHPASPLAHSDPPAYGPTYY